MPIYLDIHGRHEAHTWCWGDGHVSGDCSGPIQRGSSLGQFDKHFRKVRESSPCSWVTRNLLLQLRVITPPPLTPCPTTGKHPTHRGRPKSRPHRRVSAIRYTGKQANQYSSVTLGRFHNTEQLVIYLKLRHTKQKILVQKFT